MMNKCTMPVLITAICSSSKLFQSTIPCNLILTFYGNTSKSWVGIIGREKNTEYKSRFPLLPGISLPEPRMSNDLILPHSLQPAHMSFSIQYQTCWINACNVQYQNQTSYPLWIIVDAEQGINWKNVIRDSGPSNIRPPPLSAKSENFFCNLREVCSLNKRLKTNTGSDME